MDLSRLGRDWNPARRLCWWELGRINAARALFTRSPSTPQILTSEFVIADLRALRRLFGACAGAFWFLWRLHRKDPGWFVGEHIHVFLGPGCFLTTCVRLREGLTVEIDRLGETDPSRENRTAEADMDWPDMLTRGGEADLISFPAKKVEERVAKLELDEAKPFGED